MLRARSCAPTSSATTPSTKQRQRQRETAGKAGPLVTPRDATTAAARRTRPSRRLAVFTFRPQPHEAQVVAVSATLRPQHDVARAVEHQLQVDNRRSAVKLEGQ